MSKVSFPYGKKQMEYDFSNEKLIGILTSSIEEYVPQGSETELVQQALENPVGSERLRDLARNKQRIVIIASDHTRPVPSKVLMPLMLAEIRSGNPSADITILIATGCHRGTTPEELIDKFGEEIVRNEHIYIHDCDETEKLVSLGALPSGGVCEINKIAAEADLLISEGFIEPHFFAGFSGGRKSVLPGISSRKTVLQNHCSEFVNHPCARTGVLENNPIHKDMLAAAQKAKLKFIVNVVLNEEKKVLYAVAGDLEQAHAKGVAFLSSLCGVAKNPADIVITSNGGYPLDQNVYQAVKGMTAAEATIRKDGVIIMLAASGDGIGGAHFYQQLVDEPDLAKAVEQILRRNRNETIPDQWQVQVLLRVLSHAHVIYVSEMSADLIEQMHMIPANTLAEAIVKAKEILQNPNPSVLAIPNGISVMVG